MHRNGKIKQSHFGGLWNSLCIAAVEGSFHVSCTSALTEMNQAHAEHNWLKRIKAALSRLCNILGFFLEIQTLSPCDINSVLFYFLFFLKKEPLETEFVTFESGSVKSWLVFLHLLC